MTTARVRKMQKRSSKAAACNKKKINSRTKGKTGELELAALLREHGFDARRGQQFHGGGDSPDVVSEALSCYHFECKRKEAGNPYDWLAQAENDGGIDKTPIVAHRRNGKQWIAILNLEDLLRILKGQCP